MKNYGDEYVWINGIPSTINDLEDRFMRASFSIGHFYTGDPQIVYVKDVEWPYTPDYCPVEDYKFKWFYNGTFLLCMGCGIDGT